MHNDDILLCHILKCKPIDLCINKPVLTPQQEQVFNLLKDRLRHGEPLQYILGEWDFCGLTFKVSPAVLVPRPETEVMVEKAINTVSSIQALNGNAAQDINILDIGTGSGCIAITLAKHFPKVKITAFDISSDALTIARDNALRHGVSQRIDFQCIDIKDFMKVTGTFMNVPAPFGDCCAVTFDLIISNPPYIPSGQIASLPLDVRKEPHLALDGGMDGLDFFRILIKMTPGLIKQGGYLMMEFGDGQAESVRRMAEAYFKDINIYQDLTGKDRFISGMLKERY